MDVFCVIWYTPFFWRVVEQEQKCIFLPNMLFIILLICGTDVRYDFKRYALFLYVTFNRYHRGEWNQKFNEFSQRIPLNHLWVIFLQTKLSLCCMRTFTSGNMRSQEYLLHCILKLEGVYEIPPNFFFVRIWNKS